MNHPDLQESAAYLARQDQADAATKRLAEMLAKFVGQLTDEGFTQEGAEHLADTMLIAMIHE